MKSIFKVLVGIGAAIGSLFTAVSPAQAQGTAFTYEGRLNSGTNPASGTYDLQFSLFAIDIGGSPIAGPVTNAAVAVSSGLFSTLVNFGNVFTGTTNWLEIAVRTNGASVFGSPLVPRQQLTPVPYAIYAETANAAGLTGALSGNGSGLTALQATSLTGTVADAHLSANVALRAGGNAFNGQQTFASGSVGIGTTTPAKQLDVTGTAPGVAAGASIDPSVFVRVNNTSSAGNTTSPAFAGIGFGRNSTRQAIVGGTFGNDFLDFYTGGTLTAPKMRIDFGGKVGIGTTAPSTALQVVGTVTATTFAGSGTNLTGVALTGGNNTFNGTLTVSNSLIVDPAGLNDGDLSGTPLIPGSQGLVLGGLTSSAGIASKRTPGGNQFGLDLYTLREPRLSISSSGKVGIGTTTPQTPLDVNSIRSAFPAAQFDVANCGGACGQTDYQEAIRLWNQNSNGQVGLGFLVGGGSFNSNDVPQVWLGTHYGANGSANDFKIATRVGGSQLTDRLYVNGTTGNVGIGTTTPATKLDVSGEVTCVSMDVSGEVTCVAINITSDRNAKERFKPVNAREVLEKVAHLPISEWQYKTESDARHLGPMAQDFHEAFTLGRDERHIATVDESGVALAAIQGLHQLVLDQSAVIEELRTQNELQERRFAERLSALEKRLDNTAPRQRP